MSFQYSTQWVVPGRKPLFCWLIHWGNGMGGITCNHYGIEIQDRRKWGVSNWSRIKTIAKFFVFNYRVLIRFGKTAPYNPQTGVYY